jgi:transcriptional regulator with XRE-family HTH domain
MHIRDLLTDDAVLAELGSRLERHRVERNRTQAELADEAGIGRATLQRMEHGESVQLTSLIRVLRVLGLLEGLELTLPESLNLPIARLEREQRRSRVRARGRRGTPRPGPSTEAPWKWGDERGTPQP